MINKKIRERKVLSIKKKLVNIYINLMSFALVIFAIIYITYNKDIELSYQCAVAALFIFAGWHLSKNRVKLETLLAYYILFAPLFCTYIAFRFWSSTAAGFVWLIPIPFGAYIFFKNKIVVYCFCYIIFIIFCRLLY